MLSYALIQPHISHYWICLTIDNITILEREHKVFIKYKIVRYKSRSIASWILIDFYFGQYKCKKFERKNTLNDYGSESYFNKTNSTTKNQKRLYDLSYYLCVCVKNS